MVNVTALVSMSPLEPTCLVTIGPGILSPALKVSTNGTLFSSLIEFIALSLGSLFINAGAVLASLILFL